MVDASRQSHGVFCVTGTTNAKKRETKQLKISLCRCLILTSVNKSNVESKCNGESYFLTFMLQVKSNSATISFAKSLPILFKVNDLPSLECMAWSISSSIFLSSLH